MFNEHWTINDTNFYMLIALKLTQLIIYICNLCMYNDRFNAIKVRLWLYIKLTHFFFFDLWLSHDFTNDDKHFILLLLQISYFFLFIYIKKKNNNLMIYVHCKYYTFITFINVNVIKIDPYLMKINKSSCIYLSLGKASWYDGCCKKLHKTNIYT